jgi:hypothetical protein
MKDKKSDSTKLNIQENADHNFLNPAHQDSVLVMAAANFSVRLLIPVVMDATYSSSVSSLSQI